MPSDCFNEVNTGVYMEAMLGWIDRKRTVQILLLSMVRIQHLRLIKTTCQRLKGAGAIAHMIAKN